MINFNPAPTIMLTALVSRKIKERFEEDQQKESNNLVKNKWHKNIIKDNDDIGLKINHIKNRRIFLDFMSKLGGILHFENLINIEEIIVPNDSELALKHSGKKGLIVAIDLVEECLTIKFEDCVSAEFMFNIWFKY